MSTCREAEKTAWKIISDPSAPEKAWLSACDVVADTRIAPKTVGSTDAFESKFTAVCALVLAFGAALGVRAMVDSGFDWGYFFVKRLVEQPSSPQGMVAAMALILVVPPLVYGIFSGQVRAFFQKQSWIKYSPLATNLAYYGFIASRDISEWYRLVPWFALSVALSYLVYYPACKFWTWARSISPAKQLLWIPMISLSVIGLAEFIPGEINLNSLRESVGIQLAVYTTIMFALSFVGGFLSRSRRPATTILFALATTLPIVAVIALNVVGTVLSLGLDVIGAGADIGWRACFSAIVIAMVTFSSVITGGFYSGKFRGMISPRKSSSNNNSPAMLSGNFAR